MDRADRIKRLHFRAWHRGTREADYMMGGFFDAKSGAWGDAEVLWFERLLEEDDVDIMAWAIGTQPIPDAFEGPLMDQLKKLDYIPIAK